MRSFVKCLLMLVLLLSTPLVFVGCSSNISQDDAEAQLAAEAGDEAGEEEEEEEER